MKVVKGYEASALFCSVMNDQRRLIGKQSPEFTLSVIQAVFKGLAEWDRAMPMSKDKVIDVADLDPEDITKLCNLAVKFFKKEKHLAVSVDLLSHIEKVRKKPGLAGIEAEMGEVDNTRQLNLIRELILENETPEIITGAREDLRNDLLKEVKRDASDLKKLQRNARFKRAAIITAGTIGLIGSFIGCIALAAAGAVGGGLALLLIGGLGSIMGAIAGNGLVKKNLAKAEKNIQWAQDKRIHAFELLSNKEAFEKFCQMKGLDPNAITMDELLKIYG